MINNTLKTYIRYIFLSLFIVESFFFLQVVFILKHFKPEYVIVPTLLSLVVGVLVGNIQILKQKLAYKNKIFHVIADEALNEFSYFRTLSGHYEYISPSISKLIGYIESDFYNNRDFFSELIYDDDKQKWKNHLDSLNHKTQINHVFEIRLKHKNGEIVWINHDCSPVYLDGEKIGYRSVNTNITARKIAEVEIHNLAKYDTLTKLPNRQFLIDTIDESIDKKEKLALLFIDLNRFKKINDNLGHRIGDLILQQVATKLSSCKREDTFVGRLGGDEFVVLIKDFPNYEYLEKCTTRISEIISSDYVVENYTLYVGASIGVASYPKDTTNRQELFSFADRAMYQAKNINLENVIYYRDLMNIEYKDELLIEKDLRYALDNDELSVFMQPKYNFKDKKIVSFEALIRWEKDGTIIYPDRFISIAEETGLIKNITKFVINECFRISDKWHKMGLNYDISINLSPIDFMSNEIVKFLKDSLSKYKVEASWFELEITENIFLENDNKIEERINSIIDLGFRIVLDDFGTGYSSLAYITKFPINSLKIDKVFVDNLIKNENQNIPLLKAMLNLSYDLNLEVVIEGIETNAQLEILDSLNAYIVQGFLFYKPMPIKEVEDIILNLK